MPEQVNCSVCGEVIPADDDDFGIDEPVCPDCYFKQYGAVAMSDLDAEVERLR